ncbi:indole-3-glycerol phosphate synthase TrpC [uncultured Vagococcus sp.]|uniref:indole-3-glycerol phosphate synthase TrpC n=1 Tax=uncultured Vagococcus sp. TaxID=189676 RepID=UPI0028D6F640|nr:indole-3-glycerol phosphate synthase TrpC [uncultured Vagococcus sp.]
MNNFLSKIIDVKREEVAQLPAEELIAVKKRPALYDTVKGRLQQMHLIGEVKRASPSKGEIKVSVDIIQQAKAYEKAGVSAISVLTDEQFFKGSITDLKEIAAQIDLPILCKDFMIDEKQLIRARNAGASIVLLIVAALDQESLIRLYQVATDLGLEALVEVHNLEELKIAEALGAKLIGVNNRNLATFEVSLDVSHQLGPEFTTSAIYFSESGIRDSTEVASLTAHFNGVLVGETLMRAENPRAVADSLQVSR